MTESWQAWFWLEEFYGLHATAWQRAVFDTWLKNNTAPPVRTRPLACDECGEPATRAIRERHQHAGGPCGGWRRLCEDCGVGFLALRPLSMCDEHGLETELIWGEFEITPPPRRPSEVIELVATMSESTEVCTTRGGHHG